VTKGQMLPLQDYRARIALDDGFAADAATCEQLPALIDQSVAYLEAEPYASSLPRPGTAAARDVAAARRRLRALLTVRPPAPLPDHVQGWLDAILQNERRATDTIDASATRPSSADVPGASYHPGTRIALWQGDITHLGVDAIVNAANAQMLGCFRPFHACIDNAIHSAAGPRLREDCARIMAAQGCEEATGEAKITRGYHLPSRFVLHTVGPIVRGPVTDHHRLALASCYRSCLELAADVGLIRTIAFCAISTGVFGYPKVAAAEVAVRTVGTWLNAHPGTLAKVIFNVFGDDDREAYEAVLSPEAGHVEH
jgi:O-acetyl-ADP-ribose deacetylase (regulator of RNase III)